MAAPSTYKLLLQAQQAIKQLQRDLYLAERDLVLHRDVLQNIVQYGQKR